MENALVGSFGEALERLSHAAFVGRRRPLEQLDACLREAKDEPRVMSCVGLAGVGKSTLARQFADRAAREGHRIVWVDGERIPPTARAFEEELFLQLDGGWEALGRSETADLLVIDAFEGLGAIEDWLFRERLPRAGASLFVLITTRRPLAPRHTNSLGLRQVHRELRLSAFDDNEARAHLAGCGVPQEQHAAIVRFTRGHPLCQSLVASRFAADPQREFAADDASDAVSSLVHELLRDVPQRSQRDTMFALSLAHSTDVELLEAMMGSEAESLYEWAAKLPFVHQSAKGLAPHALVRHVLHRELLARYPDRMDMLTGRGLDALIQRMRGAPLDSQRALFLESIYMNRHRPAVRGRIELDEIRATSLAIASPEQIEPCAQIVRDVLGPESERLFRHWAKRQPDRLHVVLDGGRQPVGVSLSVHLHRASPEDLRLDPVVGAAHEVWRRLSPGGTRPCGCFRFYLSSGGHGPNAKHMLSVLCSGPFITGSSEPRLHSMTFSMPYPERWEPLTAVFPLERARTPALEVDGHPYGVFFGDLTLNQPPEMSSDDATHDAVRLVARRMVGVDAPSSLEPPPLDSEAAARALRAAMKDLHRAPVLADNPLVHAGGFAHDPAQFVERVQNVIESMADNPTYAESATVLRVTYLRPAGKQQAAAVELGIPFGTYRYRLRKALAELGTLLESMRTRDRR